MRVIAGTLKGRQLKSPSWEGLRPTSDKLRETLFNILAPRVVGARVLDAFAGTGALGIEALSRGARAVTFIERDRRAQALIAENLARCGIAEGYAIIRAGITRALDTLSGHPASDFFDIVLLDPPYAQTSPGAFASTVSDAARVLAPTGVLVFEHPRRSRAPATAGSLTLSRTVVSGDSALSFFTPRA
jgi:16S rRNA (guanine(966)-N(2))-methyltransferase RsmD